MADFTTLTALAIVAVSPLLRRIYIQRFWVAGRGTVIRLEGGINTNPGPGGGTWVWSPVIEYYAPANVSAPGFRIGNRSTPSRNAVGDQLEILYSPRNPSRFVLDSWNSWITYLVLTILISSVIVYVANPSQLTDGMR
jgi:hypothetical protein